MARRIQNDDSRLQKRESKLSDWDIDFINSLSKQLDNGRVFSQKQIEKLEQIWERATKNG